MRSVNWGKLYAEYKDQFLEPAAIEEKTVRLLNDDDLQKPSGFYPCLPDVNEQHFNLRLFIDVVQQRSVGKQGRQCA